MGFTPHPSSGVFFKIVLCDKTVNLLFHVVPLGYFSDYGSGDDDSSGDNGSSSGSGSLWEGLACTTEQDCNPGHTCLQANWSLCPLRCVGNSASGTKQCTSQGTKKRRKREETSESDEQVRPPIRYLWLFFPEKIKQVKPVS